LRTIILLLLEICAEDAELRKVTLDTGMEEGMTRAQISAMRKSYSKVSLETLPTDPFEAFSQWLHQASKNPIIVEANAMVLSTIDHAGEISSRTVLLKDISQHGFTFFTHYSSRKGKAIHSQPQVALLFPWYAMERQVIVTGLAEEVPRSESEEYFTTRPWESQIGAWASRQSDPLGSRKELEERWAAAAAKWPEGSGVPTPPQWGGYRVIPTTIEFWQGRYSRLHDRLRYERSNRGDIAESKWEIARYYP
jgi:pyridoxamine 5'-phosphate oxidase